MVKVLFHRAYLLSSGVGFKPNPAHSYLGAFDKANFPKGHDINLSTMVHIANSVLKYPSSFPYLV